MIILTTRFKKEVKGVLSFIAKDSKTRANNFYDELLAKLSNIPNHPLAYPKYKDNEFIRKLIYKKYVIPFEILKDDIYILGIFKKNLWSK